MRTPARDARARSRRRVLWVSRCVGLLGLLSIASALLPPVRARLDVVRELLPPFAPALATAGTVLAGTALLAVASGLRRRKRRAWWAAVVLSVLSCGLHLVKGLDVEEAVLSAAVLALLVATRREFYGAADPGPPSRHPVRRPIVATVVALVAACAVVAAERHAMATSVGAAEMLEEAALGLVGVPGPVVWRSPATAAAVSAVLLGLGALLAVTVLAEVLRAGPPAALTGPAETARLRELLGHHGEVDSLGYFALRPDRAVQLSPSEKAAVSYRVVSGVALAAGDPVGDPEAWPEAVRAWDERCERQAWVPAVLAAGERGATVYRRTAGFDAWEVGDEAVLDVETFGLQGRAMRGVRQLVNRATRAGVACSVRRVHTLPADEAEQLRRCAAAWREGPVERGFSMSLGRVADPRDPDAVVVTACAAGAPVGLLTLAPWGSDGLSLDVMRRAPDAPSGVVEAMVTTLVSTAPALGVRRISLNFAVFRSVLERGERIGAGPVLRLAYRLLLVASRFWQIESLYRANAKYHPDWVPRFLCYRDAQDLPRVLLAALRAEAFLPAVRQPSRRSPTPPSA